MDHELAEILETLHSKGYTSITPSKDQHRSEASGEVPLPEKHHRKPQARWKHLLPQIRSDTPDLGFLPDDLRSTVEEHGWAVWPISRDDDTLKVAISNDSN